MPHNKVFQQTAPAAQQLKTALCANTPEKDMSLFEGIKKDPTNADIGLWMNDRTAYYQYGYRRAAEKLVENYAHFDQRDKDSLVFPVVFLYRHHIEILLKGIIQQSRSLLSYSKKYDLGHHRILDLWDLAIDLYKSISHKVPENRLFINLSDLQKQRGKIKELNKYDQHSFSFRYSTDKKGNKEIPDIDYISVSNFKAEIDKVLFCLDQVVETLCHESDYQRESA